MLKVQTETRRAPNCLSAGTGTDRHTRPTLQDPWSGSGEQHSVEVAGRDKAGAAGKPKSTLLCTVGADSTRFGVPTISSTVCHTLCKHAQAPNRYRVGSPHLEPIQTQPDYTLPCITCKHKHIDFTTSDTPGQTKTSPLQISSFALTHHSHTSVALLSTAEEPQPLLPQQFPPSHHQPASHACARPP